LGLFVDDINRIAIGCRGTAWYDLFFTSNANRCRATTQLDLFVDDIYPLPIGCRGTAQERLFVIRKAFVCRATTQLDLFVDDINRIGIGCRERGMIFSLPAKPISAVLLRNWIFLLMILIGSALVVGNVG
jgi:hypothetical protein